MTKELASAYSKRVEAVTFKIEVLASQAKKIHAPTYPVVGTLAHVEELLRQALEAMEFVSGSER